MTDKNRKPEERNSAIRSNRGPAPVTMAQKPVPGSGLLPPTGTAHYSLHADIPAAMHYSHMLHHPSFGISLHSLPGSSVQPPPVISSDLGPPIFMPSLNLGVPHTSNSTSMIATTCLPPNNARPVTPTLSQSSSDLNASCHNSFPTVLGPAAAAQYSNPSVLRSSSLPPCPLIKPSTPPTLNSQKNPKTPTTAGGVAAPAAGISGGNSSYPVSILKQVRRQSSPSAGTAHSPLSVAMGNSDALTSAFSSATSMDVGSPVSIMKPALSKPLTTVTTTHVELASGNALASHAPLLGHPVGMATQVGLSGKTVGGGKMADDTKTGIPVLSQSDGLPSLNDGSGSNLICLEGMAPPVAAARQTVVTTSAMPTSSTTTAVMDLRAESRPPQLPTSNVQTYHSQQPLLLTSDGASYHFHATTTSSAPAAIPRPEAISKNIIIPAANLTGKDIANLTSSTTSSAATSPVVEAVPPFDRLPSGDVLLQQATAALPSDLSSSDNVAISVGSLGRVPGLVHSGHSQSPPPNPVHPTSVIQHDSALSAHVSLGHHPHGLQTGGNSNSPRPSILRRRPHESGRALEGAASPLSSQSLSRLSSSSLSGGARAVTVPESPSGLLLQENHLRENSDLVLSPRKRPRKQQFEAMSDPCFPQSLQSNEDSSAIDAAEASYAHNSIVANERLPGPLPLRNKVALGDASLGEKSPQPPVEKEIRYLAQLRRCPYPKAANCRISRRAPHHHFRRHADIKHREEVHVLLHEVANSGSTWLRASGWKITHVGEQLSEMGDVKHDALLVMEGLQSTCQNLLESSDCPYSQEHKHYLTELVQGNLDRSKRAVEHIEESRKILLSMLDQQPKVVDILKKYATRLPFDSTVQPFS